MAIQWGNNLRPMKVYHASPNDFDELDINRAKDNSSYTKGLYVADDSELVEEYGVNRYEFDFTPNQVGDIEDYDFNDEHIGKLREKVVKPYFGYMSEKEHLMKQELEKERDEIAGMFSKDGWLKQSDDNKRLLARHRLNALGRIAHDNNISLKELLRDIGVGDYDAIKIPMRNNEDKNYYVVFDPKTLKMTRKYK